jgi:hypothetical protein
VILPLTVGYYNTFMIFKSLCTVLVPCRNICTRIGSSFGYYSIGIKYCRRCEVYLFHDGYVCPCCKRPLRTSPKLDKRPDYAFQDLQTAVTKEGMMIMLRYSGPKMLEHE